MSFHKRLASQITFLYYQNLQSAQYFYEELLGLRLAQDQGWAKIYQLNGTAFIGIVDEAYGSLKTQPENAVMVSLVVDDVAGWYAYIQTCGIAIYKPLAHSAELNMDYFFIQDPGGYVIEIQQFLAPSAKEIFGC